MSGSNFCLLLIYHLTSQGGSYVLQVTEKQRWRETGSPASRNHKPALESLCVLKSLSLSQLLPSPIALCEPCLHPTLLYRQHKLRLCRITDSLGESFSLSRQWFFVITCLDSSREWYSVTGDLLCRAWLTEERERFSYYSLNLDIWDTPPACPPLHRYVNSYILNNFSISEGFIRLIGLVLREFGAVRHSSMAERERNT